jgi:hypothetical protein
LNASRRAFLDSFTVSNLRREHTLLAVENSYPKHHSNYVAVNLFHPKEIVEYERYFTATLNFHNPATHIPPLDVNTCKITTSKGSISPPTGETCKVSNKLKDNADWTYTLKA